MTKLLIIARSYLNRCLRREEGATMAEYGLLLTLIAIVVIAGATALGKQINAVYEYVSTQLTT